MTHPRITFNGVFRSWLVETPGVEDDTFVPRLIIKTGFTRDVGTEQWPHLLHEFIVYDGRHGLLGTLQPRQPQEDGARRFSFHRHSRNDHVELAGPYRAMEEVIAALLVLQERGELDRR